MQVMRLQKVRNRAELAFAYMSEYGPAMLTEIAAGIGVFLQRTRYAVHALRVEQRAHIASYQYIKGPDLITRYAARYAAGDGVDAFYPGVRMVGVKSGHLQSIYMDWGATRTPAYPVSDEDWVTYMEDYE